MSQSIALPPTVAWRELLRERRREVAGVGVLAAAAALAVGGAMASPRNQVTEPVEAGPPAPPPLLVRPIAPTAAMSINQAIPIAAAGDPAALPFSLGKNAGSRAQALECLTSAVYYEAGSQDVDGQRAVAQVVLNRVRHPAFPASVCGVVYQGSTRITGCQFTFTCDGSLARQPSIAGWRRAREVAQAALAGAVFAPVGLATHYHANYVVPYWASSLAKNAVVGAHIFYRWAGGWGRPNAFAQRYAGKEPDSRALRTAALAAEAAEQAMPKPAVKSEEVAQAIAEVPGAEVKPAEAGRVALRFNMAARKAVEEAPRQPYVERVEASDNLRWTLSNAPVESNEKPLGKATTPSAAGGGGGSGGGAAAPQL